MAASHPYISGAGSVASMVQHLRKSFPQSISSDTVKKLGLAPKNESYVINALQFVGIIDEDGNKTDKAAKTFSLHKDEDFESAFGEMVKAAYKDLFDLHGENTWALRKDDLITFFRQADQTSAVIGGRQVNLFLAFSALAGHGELQTKTKPSTQKYSEPKKKKKRAEKPLKNTSGNMQSENETPPLGQDFSLNVKVEINIPSDADAEAYDNIFASIRKHLMNG